MFCWESNAVSLHWAGKNKERNWLLGVKRRASARFHRKVFATAEQAEKKACECADVQAELLTMEGAGHGFRGADAEKAEKAMLAFFARHLKKR
jgi:hypothetical protein